MRDYLRDIRRVINPRTLTVLLLISLFITVLEVASISAVVPTIGIILGEGVPIGLDSALRLLGINSPNLQSLLLTLFVALIFLARGALLSGAIWLQSRLVFKTQSQLSDNLFVRFMNARFDRVTGIATSKVVRTSTTELANVTLGCLLPLAALMSELAMIIGSILVLLAVEPIAAVSLLVAVFVLSFPILWLNRRRLGRLGRTRHDMEDDRVRLAQELVAGIREIKVYGLREQFASVVTKTNESYSQVMIRLNFLQNLPRIYFETLGVCALLITCAVQLSLGRNNRDVLMFLTLAAFAAFRTLPSVAKLLSNWQAIRFYRPSLAAYVELIDLLEQDNKSNESLVDGVSVNPLKRIHIQMRDAAYRHSDHGSWIFKDLDLDLRAGEFIGLVGPSGVGKSTLLDCLIGLRTPTLGGIKVMENDTDRLIDYRVGYVPQTPVILEGSIGRNITLGQKGSTDPTADDPLIVDALFISGFDVVMRDGGFSLSSHVTEGGRNLSGGQRQRLALARALYRNADILVLDEATSALDADSERSIFAGIKARAADKIVIMVTHRTELLSFCHATLTLQPEGVSIERRNASLTGAPNSLEFAA